MQRGVKVKKKELLVPVGSREALFQAIHNGADAVYLGGKNFGARKFAQNFTDDEMMEAIELCHLYGVKIYVTVNTLIYDEEVEDFLSYVKFLYDHHVDAVLVQDFGMLCLIREIYPDLEVHASTQMHNQSQEELDLLERLGVKRVVLARELSLSKIQEFKTHMELEVFIHGALCICYSGCCLMSSMVGGRSGNRGECAGSCRLPYQLLENGEVVPTSGPYLLSTKDLATWDYFEDLMHSQIDSFKIEGRMKSPEYVGFITRFYRDLIDQYEQTGHIVIKPEKIKELKILFSRGFTKGHLFDENQVGLMNIQSPNHIGVKIGNVLEVTPKKIKMQLTEDLTQEDGIRFLESGKGMIVNFLYDLQGRLIHEAQQGSIVYVDNKVHLKTKDQVHKTLSFKLMGELRDLPRKKIPISMAFTLKKGAPATLTVIDPDQHRVFLKGEVVMDAKDVPLTRAIVEEKLRKLGATPFMLEELTIDLDDNVFFPMSSLNQMRRLAFIHLENIRRNAGKAGSVLKFQPDLKMLSTKTVENYEVTASVCNEEQLRACLALPLARIYVRDLKLYQSYMKDSRIIYQGHRVGSTPSSSALLVRRFGDLLSTDQKVGDYTLNVANAYTVYYLQKFGLSRVTLSSEMNERRVEQLIHNYEHLFGLLPPVEQLIYGRVELMVMKHCLLNHLVQEGKRPCALCRNGKTYQLKDRYGAIYPVESAKETTTIWSSVLDFTDELSTSSSIGVRCFRLSFFDEQPKDIERLYQKVTQQLKKVSYQTLENVVE